MICFKTEFKWHLSERSLLFSYATVCGLIIKVVPPVKYTIVKDEILLPFSESQPYQELDGGEPVSSGMGALRLDDDNEFPPMMHKLDS